MFQKKVGKDWKEQKKHCVHKKKLGRKKKSWGEKKHCGQKSWTELKKTNIVQIKNPQIRII